MNGKIVGCILVLGMAASLAAAQENTERNRGIYFEAGLGFGGVSYGDELDQAISLAEGLGADRSTVYLDLGLGFALTQRLYAIAEMSGIGDRLQYPNGYMQLNTYLYSAGIRYYPFTRGLQLGADVGMGAMVLQSSESEYNNLVSEKGGGLRFTAAYDFDSTRVGPAALLGFTVLVDAIEDESITGVGLFLNFVYK